MGMKKTLIKLPIGDGTFTIQGDYKVISWSIQGQ